jgi:hypothetical protein
MARKTTTIAREKSGGNVFADLGLPHREQELLKARHFWPDFAHSTLRLGIPAKIDCCSDRSPMSSVKYCVPVLSGIEVMVMANHNASAGANRPT